MLGFSPLSSTTLGESGASLDRILSASLVTDPDTLYSATVSYDQALTPSLYSASQAFYAPTTTTFLYPAQVTDTDSWHSPTLTVGAVGLNPSYVPSSSAVYSHQVGVGEMTLLPSLLTDANVFGGHVIQTSVQLAALRLDSVSEIYGQLVWFGDVTLEPVLVSDGDSFLPLSLYRYSKDSGKEPVNDVRATTLSLSNRLLSEQSDIICRSQVLSKRALVTES